MLTDIRDAMVREFDISVEEASGRIASVLGSWDLESEQTERSLGHEDETYWANFIYYGPDVDWWRLPRDQLEPRRWP